MLASETAVESWARVKLPSTAALPVLVMWPVRLALVVTLPAVRPDAVPVQLVRMPLDGVPRAGVVNVGLVSVLFVSVATPSMVS